MGGKKQEYTDAQLERIARHVTKGLIEEKVNGNPAAAEPHYRRAKVVTETAKLSNKKK